MRLEGKHRELKQYSNVINSRVNLPYYLLYKQQLKFANRICRQHGFNLSYDFGPKTNVYIDLIKQINFLSYESEKRIKFNGTKYEENFVIKTNNSEY